MKKYFRFLMCALLLAGFAACSDDEDPVPGQEGPGPGNSTKLETPVLSQGAVTKDSFIVTWSAVEHATSYVYSINGGTETSTTDLRIYRSGMESNTTYAIKVKAVAEGYADSDYATIDVTTEEVVEPYVEITYSEIGSYDLIISFEPNEQTQAYWPAFLENEIMSSYSDDELIEALASGESTNAPFSQQMTGLKPAVEYCGVAVAVDADGNYAVTRALVTTKEKEIPNPIESALFEELQGTWSGVQTISAWDENGQPNGETETAFTVTIDDMEGDYSYRLYNQLVCKVDGWDGIPFYGSSALIAEGWSEEAAYLDYGPKWVLEIDESDNITINGEMGESCFAWSESGDVYMFGASPSSYQLLQGDFIVTLSEDKNTMTIATAASEDGYYPGLFFNSGGWYIVTLGYSDIVLTRDNSRASTTSAALGATLPIVKPTLSKNLLQSNNSAMCTNLTLNR